MERTFYHRISATEGKGRRGVPPACHPEPGDTEHFYESDP